MQTKTALIVIDFQNARTDDQSDYYVGNLKELITKTNYLINYARNMDYKIIFTKHIEQQGDFAEHSINSHIMDGIEKSDTDIVIQKNKISSFYKTNMEEELNGIENVVVCGILTNLCVRSFVQDAYDRDYKIVLIKDCCIAFDKKIHEFTLEDLKQTREEIDILELEAFLE
ncbi:MAG: isochorismatase family cysteine hydrolase [Candidatus Absconditicoccaceae bacterium]